MKDGAIVSGVSVAHDCATLDQLETVSRPDQQASVAALLAEDDVSEAFVLQTCNRVEAYVVTDDPARGSAVLADFVAEAPDDIVEELNHEQSLRHLLRVAAGLESLVLGEDQIIGQVRDAFEDARAADGIGPVLEAGVTKAIRVGERARTETAINEGVVSLASAAVKLASEKRGLDGATAAVVGAGEMGTLAAKRLADRVDELRCVNRTLSAARRLEDTVEPTSSDVSSVPLEDLPAVVEDADVVITATGSPEAIVDADHLATAGETFVVDITRPRDVPERADEFPHLTVYDLDALEAVTEKTRERRREAALEVEAIVDQEFERLLAQYKRRRADAVISAMYESAERVKAAELEETLDQLDLDDEDAATVESMADAIVSQLLAAPTNSLRDAAENDEWSTIHTALTLFDPRFGPESEAISPAFALDRSGEDAESVEERTSSGENTGD